MSEKKENSVLFSLRELRTIEEERVQEESERLRSEEEARIRAEQDAIERKRAEEEARIKAAEDAERQAREEVERRQREEQLRLEEAERKARVAAQSKLDQERLQKEMEIRAIEAQKKRPTWLIGLAVGLLVLVVGLGAWAYKNKQKATQELALYQAKVEKVQSELKELIRQKDADVDKMMAAKTEEERKQANAALEKRKMEIAAKERELERIKSAGKKGNRGGRGGSKPNGDKKPPKPNPTKNDPCRGNPDPLCGIKG